MNGRCKNNDEELYSECPFVFIQRIRTESEYILAANNAGLLSVCQVVVRLLIQAIFLRMMFFVNAAWSRHVS